VVHRIQINEKQRERDREIYDIYIERKSVFKQMQLSYLFSHLILIRILLFITPFNNRKKRTLLYFIIINSTFEHTRNYHEKTREKNSVKNSIINEQRRVKEKKFNLYILLHILQPVYDILHLDMNVY
jgi:uncharacterized membrane protein